MGNAPAVGKIAPAFSATVVGGSFTEPTTVRLADFRGEPLVLYFYPKDETPGCTRQACGLRDRWDDIRRRARVLGVSGDPVASHRRFIDKHRLPFPLVADEDHAVAEKYHVWVEKSLYGRRYMGTERTTFILGPDLRIRAILAKVKPDRHVEDVISALEGFGGGERPSPSAGGAGSR